MQQSVLRLTGFNRATVTFLAIIVVAFIPSVIAMFIVSAKGEGSADGFWVSNILRIVLYGLFYMVFWFVNRANGIRGKEVFNKYYIKKEVKTFNVIKIISLGLICLVTFVLIQTAFTDLFKIFGYSENNELAINNASQYVVYIITLGVLPAIIEELIFRGIILQKFMEHGKTIAVLSSALLFSLFHLSPAQTVYQFALGIIFAAVAIKTGNIVFMAKKTNTN